MRERERDRGRERKRGRMHACGATNAAIPAPVALRGTHMCRYTQVSDDAVIDVAAHQPFLLASTCAFSHSLCFSIYRVLSFSPFFSPRSLFLSFSRRSRLFLARASCHTREQELQSGMQATESANVLARARTAAVLVAILTIPSRE